MGRRGDAHRFAVVFARTPDYFATLRMRSCVNSSRPCWPEFHAEAGLLHAAIGHAGRQVQVLVDPHRAGVQALGHFQRALGALRPHRAAEAVLGGIGALDGLVDGLVLQHRHHRAELLLAHQPRRIRQAADDGGLDEEALALVRLAAGDDLALRARVFDDGAHLLELHAVLQRAELHAFLEAIAHLRGGGQLRRAPRTRRRRSIRARRCAWRPGTPGRSSPSRRRTAWVRSPSDPRHRARWRRRCRPAPASGASASCAALAITLRPVAVEPVKAILATSGWLVSAPPRSLASAITLTTPGGKISAHSSPDLQRGQRRGGRRLHHHGVAGQQRRRQLGHHHDHREIPRRDGGHHAQRQALADHPAPVVFLQHGLRQVHAR